MEKLIRIRSDYEDALISNEYDSILGRITDFLKEKEGISAGKKLDLEEIAGKFILDNGFPGDSIRGLDIEGIDWCVVLECAPEKSNLMELGLRKLEVKIFQSTSFRCNAITTQENFGTIMEVINFHDADLEGYTNTDYLQYLLRLLMRERVYKPIKLQDGSEFDGNELWKSTVTSRCVMMIANFISLYLLLEKPKEAQEVLRKGREFASFAKRKEREYADHEMRIARKLYGTGP